MRNGGGGTDLAGGEAGPVLAGLGGGGGGALPGVVGGGGTLRCGALTVWLRGGIAGTVRETTGGAGLAGDRFRGGIAGEGRAGGGGGAGERGDSWGLEVRTGGGTLRGG